MLPMPQTRVWSSSARLSPVRRRRSAAANASVVEVRVERVAGDVRDRHRHAVDQVRRRRARRRCAGRRTAAPGRRRRRRAGPAGASRPGVPGCRTSSWPLIPRCASTASLVAVQRQPEVLAAAAGAGERAAGQPAGEVGGTAGVPADRPGVGDVDGGDGAPGDPLAPGRGGRPRPRAAQAWAGTRSAAVPAVGSPSSGSPAAQVPATRSRRPPARPPSCCARCPSPYGSPPTRTTAVNDLLVVRARSR